MRISPTIQYAAGKYFINNDSLNKSISELKAVSALTSAINDLITEALQSYKREVKNRERRIEELTTRLRDLKEKPTQNRTLIEGLLDIIEDLNHTDNKNGQILIIELFDIMTKRVKNQMEFEERTNGTIEDAKKKIERAQIATDRIAYAPVEEGKLT